MTLERSVRAITVSPEFWMLKTEMAGRLLREKMIEQPADVWIIFVGPAGSAHRFMADAFIYGPAESEEVGR